MIDTVILAVSNPMFVWYMVVAVLLIACLVYSFRLAHHHRTRRMRLHHLHAIEMGNERDMFYIPGDQKYDDRDADFDEL
ncbi:MAG: hypothetical protein HDS68_05725 [Bacteroidales bacterium]|nr:hypothetical protein [Bacteroidales bacterium]